jgi:alpha-glucosidase (family GH31 glycosyl hydrolase)
MDFWWIDGTGKPPFPGADDQGWLSRQYFELAEEKSGKRGLVLARFGGIGSHRYPVQFSGDAKSDWATLAHQIQLTAESCGVGAAWWSHDLGGFWGQEPLPDELYIRWCQFGALSPVMRLHSHFNGERRPWQFKKRTLKHFREITRFRYSLFPCLYTLAHEAHVSGMPLVRPMYLEDPENEKAYVHPYQYCLGRDLLVMPAHSPVEKGETLFKKQVYFPEGEWVDIHTGEVVWGSLLETIEIPLHRLPVYARVGSIVPCQDVVPNLKTAPKSLWLDIYPKDTVRTVLYEDDGLSRKYLSGKWAKTRISAVKTDRKISVTVSAPAGPFRARRKTITVNCFLRSGETAKAVRVNNGKVPFRVINQSFAGTVRSRARFVNFTVSDKGRGFRAEVLF